jgi:hypothetical protein
MRREAEEKTQGRRRRTKKRRRETDQGEEEVRSMIDSFNKELSFWRVESIFQSGQM